MRVLPEASKYFLISIVLVARGQLVPGSNVFVRGSDSKSYIPGLVSNMDQKMSVIVDGERTLSYDLNDVRGVVLDELPLVSEVAVGTKVIAFVKDDEPYRAGVVLRILESSDQSVPNVLVKFGPGEEEVKPFEQIRLLKNVKNGGELLSSHTVKPAGTRRLSTLYIVVEERSRRRQRDINVILI